MTIERDIVTIERHRVWIEEPFALVCEIEGDLDEGSLRQIRDMMDYIGGGRGPVIIMQNLTKAGVFTASARKGIVQDKRTARVETVICIGASFQMRVFMGMLRTATKLVYPRMPIVLFAKDETEGRAMLAAARERLQRENSNSNS